MSIVVSGSIAFGPRIVTEDLVFLVDALNPQSGQSDTVWNDLIQELTGTLSGTTYVQDGGQTNFEYESGSIVQYSDKSNIQNVFDGGGTIECWLNSEDAQYSPGWMDKSLSASNGWSAYIGPNLDINFVQYFNTSGSVFSTTTGILSLNNWHHVSLTYDCDTSSSLPTAYVDGNSYSMFASGSVEGTRESDVGVMLEIGNRGNADPLTTGLKGHIARAGIYNRMLSEVEIKQNFQALRSRYGIEETEAIIGPPIIRNVQTDTSVNGGNIVITRPEGLVVGDLMVAFIAAGGMTPSFPSGWEIWGTNSEGNGYSAVFGKVADSDDVSASNFTFSFSGADSADSACGALLRVTGYDGYEGSETASGYSATQTAPNAGVYGNNRLVLRFCGLDDDVTITVATITKDFELTSNDTYDSAASGGHETQSGEETGTYNFTTAINENYTTYTVVIAPLS